METAVITVVISDGIDYQEVVEAKDRNKLDKEIMNRLPQIIKLFHDENGFLEQENDEYYKEIAEDIIEDETEPYSPSYYAGSGFIQVKFF